MFLPKKSKIFDNLTEQSLLIEKAARMFQKISRDWNRLSSLSRTFEQLESQADNLVHLISSEALKTFILPLDKEDIGELTERLDDVIDGLEQTVNRLMIYKIQSNENSIPGANDAIKRFADIMVQATSQIHQGILQIKDRRMHAGEFSECCQKLHALENQGDSLHRNILKNMMKAMDKMSPDCRGSQIIALIKWKEIFQTLEDTLDVCEKIAIIFEKLRIKYM